MIVGEQTQWAFHLGEAIDVLGACNKEGSQSIVDLDGSVELTALINLQELEVCLPHPDGVTGERLSTDVSSGSDVPCDNNAVREEGCALASDAQGVESRVPADSQVTRDDDIPVEDLTTAAFS